MSIDIQQIRSQFPILNREVNGKPLVYLDNGATSQKPKVVLDVLDEYYEKYNANVHRGIHTLSQEATDLMEESRRKIKNLSMRNTIMKSFSRVEQRKELT